MRARCWWRRCARQLPVCVFLIAVQHLEGTSHLAELMNNEGTVIANDVHPHKRKLIEEQAQWLGLTSVKAVTGDALELASQFDADSFDLVLLDAPCSGFGVIRRKPEIKWTKSSEDVTAYRRASKQAN